jgi:tetratricopeptide (TPR) repeat protein
LEQGTLTGPTAANLVCKIRHHLALIWRDQGRTREAEAHWKSLVQEVPSFLNAWIALADLYVSQERWDTLDELVGQLRAEPRREVEAAVLVSRELMARREFAQARQQLEEAITRQPKALWPRVALSHVLLSEGRDYRAAEQALHEVLALEPTHAEARHNLARLRAKADTPIGHTA